MTGPKSWHHIETHSALVVSNAELVILDCTTKQLNQRDEKTSKVESVFQYGNRGVVSLVVKPRVVIPLSRVRFPYFSPNLEV